MMASLVVARLANRKLLRIIGPDCYPYLQGLLCNDVRYLYEPDRIPEKKYAKVSSNVMSSFMLNAQGRAICDLLLYRTPSTRQECNFTPPGQAKEPDELLIECDSSLASGLANTLYGYRVRRKISLTMEEAMSVWCLFPKFDATISNPALITNDTLLNVNSYDAQEKVSEELTFVHDPRLWSMGIRVISRKGQFEEVKAEVQSLINTEVTEASFKDYTKFRYLLGVGEGVKDHPESNCLPLECNADFLNSVSFTKGCYLGQELTARIHYTGVVRKRLMPVIFDLKSGSKEQGVAPLVGCSDILDKNTKKKVGTLRHLAKDRGLALLRHDLATGSQLVHEGSETTLSTYVPHWWLIKK